MEKTSIQYRSMPLQVLWMVLTGGLYAIYWYYVTHREMASALGREEEVMLWTVFLCLPITNFYSYYKTGELYEELTRKEMDRWLIFVLWIVFPPAVWWIVQRRLNRLADSLDESQA